MEILNDPASAEASGIVCASAGDYGNVFAQAAGNVIAYELAGDYENIRAVNDNAHDKAAEILNDPASVEASEIVYALAVENDYDGDKLESDYGDLVAWGCENVYAQAEDSGNVYPLP